MAASTGSPEDYLKSLPAERRRDITEARKLVAKYMPKGYVERLAGKAIAWEIPLADYPNTYNKQPLAYVALSAQKHYNALYLMGCYTTPSQRKRLEEAYREAGRAFDMGKSCLRFGAFEELPAKVLGELIAEVTPADYIRIYEKSRSK